jgi:murein DD-endopeptidase MepM/ murein hydrolase activator NlpD
MFQLTKIPARFAAAALIATLTACATAPTGGSPGGGAVAAGDLYLCQGVKISNAPAADNYRKVISYTPYARIRGVTLARAPVSACISSAYGPRRGGAGAFHDGLDLYTGSPRPAFAAGDAIVEFSGMQRGYGNVVVLNHRNGVATRYAHLSSISRRVSSGARISAGEEIGMTGRTGNATAVHLHYEILVDGRTQNPLTIGD